MTPEEQGVLDAAEKLADWMQRRDERPCKDLMYGLQIAVLKMRNGPTVSERIQRRLADGLLTTFDRQLLQDALVALDDGDDDE